MRNGQELQRRLALLVSLHDLGSLLCTMGHIEEGTGLYERAQESGKGAHGEPYASSTLEGHLDLARKLFQAKQRQSSGLHRSA